MGDFSVVHRPPEGTSATLVAPWCVDIQRAVQANLRDGLIRRLLPDEVAAEFIANIPYRFLGERHHIVGHLVCEARRYGACADAAAAIMASCIAQGLSAHLCVEAPAHLQTYTHVRVLVDGLNGRPMALDPYKRYRPRGVSPSCEWISPASMFGIFGAPVTLYRPTVQT